MVRSLRVTNEILSAEVSQKSSKGNLNWSFIYSTDTNTFKIAISDQSSYFIPQKTRKNRRFSGFHLPKIESLKRGGGSCTIFARKGGITLNKRGGDCYLFYYFTVQLHLLYCVGKVKFPLLRFHSSVFWINHARFSPKYL